MDSGADADIVRRCLAGDERAYRELVARYQRQVFSLARRMTGSVEDAEDLTQETFIRMFRALERYDPNLLLHAGLSVSVDVDTQHRRPWLVWLDRTTERLFGGARAGETQR